MKRQYLKWMLLMELCCLSYIFHPILYVLSRKGISGTAELIYKYIPFTPIHGYLIKFINLIPKPLYSPLGLTVYYGGITIFFYLTYLSTLKILKKENIGLNFFILWTLIFCVTLFFNLPVKHADIFLYIFQGKMVYYYQANPYFVTPSMFEKDHLLKFVGWKNFTSTYGPFWHIVAAVLYRLGTDNIYLEICVFKIFITICHLTNVVLIYYILHKIKPEFKTIGTILYAWNPLVLIYSSAHSHNDFLMITLLLTGIYLFCKKEIFLPVCCFAFSFLTKFVYIFFFPFYIKILPTKKEILFSIVVFLFVTVLIWFPFYRGPLSFVKPFWMAGFLSHSITFLGNIFLSSLLGQNIATYGTKILQSILYVSFLFLYVYLLSKTKSLQDIFNSCAIIFFLLVATIMPNWATWYVAWCIPFAVLSTTPNIILTCSSFSFSALFASIVYFFSHSYAPKYQALTFFIAIPLPLFVAIKTKIWCWNKNETYCDNTGL